MRHFATTRFLLAGALALATFSGCTRAAEPAAAPSAEAVPAAEAIKTPTIEDQAVLFWTPAQQVANYPHMEKLFNVHTVRKGATSSPLPVAAKPLELAWSHGGQDWTFDSYMERNRGAGLLVIKDGEIVLEKYALSHGPDQRWTSFSVAKSFSSTLVGAAIRDGKIKSLDDPITTYLTGLKGSAYEGVSVRQLLQMTSGVKWNESYTDPNSDVAKFSSEPSVDGSDPVVTYMARLPREAEPGTKWVYKTGETNLVGSLVRAATGKTLSDYLSEKVWGPVGMEQDAVWMLDLGGGEVAGCCLSATLKDYGRFGLFFMGGAKVNGVSILPDNWVAEATTSTPEALADMNGASGYGFQWWTTPGKAYRGSGIFGQGLWINPELNLVVVSHSAWAKATDPELSATRQAMIDAIEAHYRKR
jgi:CubicO group peptidase (beta-lactamase class C family)